MMYQLNLHRVRSTRLESSACGGTWQRLVFRPMDRYDGDGEKKDFVQQGG
jgi:hypothetical protein